jgi:hypothetical protein
VFHACHHLHIAREKEVHAQEVGPAFTDGEEPIWAGSPCSCERGPDASAAVVCAEEVRPGMPGVLGDMKLERGGSEDQGRNGEE